ncbi:calpain small subunit 1-like [Trachemys scripta elegans]|uniref:calpain small subunit 1-like n=1 Tax=Trachemys scripta elegans TaxID=31138 RepID=UPI001556D163|nr:calpain small subunit 1-like [Trachemys scripta elegans]
MPSSTLAGEIPCTALQSHTTGKLGFEEFKYLWGNVKKWQCVYKQYDTDRSGTIGSSELPGAFEAAGFRLNEQLYQMIVRRYSDENGHMDFDNFISCLVRLDAMFRKWPAGRSWGWLGRSTSHPSLTRVLVVPGLASFRLTMCRSGGPRNQP